MTPADETAAMPSGLELSLAADFLEYEARAPGRFPSHKIEAALKTAAWLRRLISDVGGYQSMKYIALAALLGLSACVGQSCVDDGYPKGTSGYLMCEQSRTAALQRSFENLQYQGNYTSCIAAPGTFHVC